MITENVHCKSDNNFNVINSLFTSLFIFLLEESVSDRLGYVVIQVTLWGKKKKYNLHRDGNFI